MQVPPRSGEKLPEAEKFGAYVRKLRLAKGWSQEKLAEEAELNSVQISIIERGGNDPKLTTILKLSRGLGLRAPEMLRAFK